MGRGRPPKPTAVLDRQGTKKKHRHDDRADKAYESAELECPAELTGYAREHWEMIVANTPAGVLSAVDSHSLFAMATAWQLFREMAAVVATTKERTDQMQMSNAFQMWYSLAIKFGLTPADRAKLRLEAEKEVEADPFVEMLKSRAGNN